MRPLTWGGMDLILLPDIRRSQMRTELRMASGKACNWLLPMWAYLRLGHPSRSVMTLVSVSSSKREVSALLQRSSLVRRPHLSMHAGSRVSLLLEQVNSSSEGSSMPSLGSSIALFCDKANILSLLNPVSLGKVVILQFWRFKLQRLGRIGREVILPRLLPLQLRVVRCIIFAMQVGNSTALADFLSSTFRPLLFASSGKLKLDRPFIIKISSFSSESMTLGRVDIRDSERISKRILVHPSSGKGIDPIFVFEMSNTAILVRFFIDSGRTDSSLFLDRQTSLRLVNYPMAVVTSGNLLEGKNIASKLVSFRMLSGMALSWLPPILRVMRVLHSKRLSGSSVSLLQENSKLNILFKLEIRSSMRFIWLQGKLSCSNDGQSQN